MELVQVAPANLARGTTQRVREEQREAIEQYVGIRHHFSDPFHLYLHKGDVEGDGTESAPTVRFIVYSMGRKKVVMIGFYDRRRSRFQVTYACRYTTRDLINYMNSWEENFTSVLTIMKNRVAARIDAFTGQPPSPILTNRDDYHQLKFWLALYPYSAYYKGAEMTPNGLATQESIRNSIQRSYVERLGNYVPDLRRASVLEREIMLEDLAGVYASDLVEKRERLHMAIAQRLDAELQSYEARMNLLDQQIQDQRVIELSELFYNWLATALQSGEAWYQELGDCTCQWGGEPGCQIISWGTPEAESFI